MKTSELIGPTLDWAVAKCVLGESLKYVYVSKLSLFYHDPGDNKKYLRYSSDWAQGGPIIDSIKGFEFKQWLEAKAKTCCEAHIHNYDGDWIQFGPTPLIAAMRCYVASKLGDEIKIPKELL